MKILVYGAGVLGCNLARNLLRAGKDVTLLARGNWAWVQSLIFMHMTTAQKIIYLQLRLITY